VWLEKPACTSLEDFEVLRRLSTENQRILHVDYLYLFNPLIHQIKELIQSSEIISFHAVRMNQNHIGASSGFHEQIDLIYDLGVHDLSIFSFLVPQVKRFQFKHQIDSKNHVLILFGRLDQIDVRIELSWKHTHKVRQLLITLLNGIIIEFTLDDQGCEVLNVFEIGGIEQIQYQQQFDSLKQSLLHFYLNISKMDDDQTLLDVASDVHKAIQIGFRLNM
jgi:predicted dehydrogenase